MSAIFFIFGHMAFFPRAASLSGKSKIQSLNHDLVDVSKNRGGTPKSPILIGVSIMNHPF